MSAAVLADEERRTLLALARAAIVDRLLDDGSLERVRERVRLTPALRTACGSFVTLRLRDDTGAAALRGCIGTIVGDEPLHRNVVRNAEHSAFHDPRFPAVRPDEVDRLTIEISVLTPLRDVARAEDIVPGRDGVHLESAGARAVFLPQVAVEHGWDRRQLLEQLAVKAGLARDGWHGAELKVFQAEVFGEGRPARP